MACNASKGSEMATRKPRRRSNDLKRINSYKLFYHRHYLQLEIEQLAAITGISVDRLRKLELGVNCTNAGPTMVTQFPEIETRELGKLEKALKCPGKLSSGMDDDFGTSYMAYWNKYHNTPTIDSTPTVSNGNWIARAIIFDFDGTLTKPGSTRTTWEAIWQSLGYNDNECGLLANRFFQGEISHTQWCQLTLEKFKARKLGYEAVTAVAANIELIGDFDECMAEIQSLGIPAYIVSGSIWDVIVTALGDRVRFFRRIEANAFGYMPDKTIGTITGTRFDFEGKGDFVREISAELNVSPSEILFVGNSINDLHVKPAGARTLLVNPHFTSPSDRSAWDLYIPRMTSLNEILPFVDSSWQLRRSARIMQQSDSAVNVLKEINEISLAAISVFGRYRRYSNEERAALVGLANSIRKSLLEKSHTRENFLVCASPGSGKTFFVEELARTLADRIHFVPIDLSRDERNVCAEKLEQAAASKRPCLCMIDEIDGRKGEEWPYDLIYKKLDLNELPDRASVVFVLIGSTGGTVKKLSEAIQQRYKGKDMIDRVPGTSTYMVEIPPMGIGDTICVYASKILEAAGACGKDVQEIEKFAAFHAVLTCRSPRQIKLLADQAVRRLQTQMTQVHFDHHFEPGDKANKAFWKQNEDVASILGRQTFRVRE